MLGNTTLRIKASIAIVLLLILIKFALVPFYNWKDDAIQRIRLLQKAVAQKKALIGNEHRIDDMLKKAENSLKQVMKFYYTDFSDTQSLQLLIQKEMERLSVYAGVKIKNTDWLYPSEGDIIQTPIKLRLEATQDQLIRFIHAIENSERFLSVDNLKIYSRERSSTLNAELDVSAYGVKDIK